MKLIVKFLILSAICLLGSLQAQNNDTTMTVDFQVMTTSPGGNYSPRNIGAIWVEDANGSFIRTLKVWADRRKQYLYTWNNRTGGSTVSGVTGATSSSHGTRSVSWDFTDLSGDTVESGDYMLWVEMTDQHSQGPLFSFSFPYMGATETINPPEQTNFHSMQLDYNLTIIVGLDGEPRLVPDQLVLEQNFPNPFNPSTAINFIVTQTGPVEMNVYDLNGRLVQKLVNKSFDSGEHRVNWDGRNMMGEPLKSGMYLCRVDAQGESRSIKMILLK